MNYTSVTSDSQLQQFCSSIQDAEIIGFDTEFVAEDSYRPELCLVQVAAGGTLGIIDPLTIDDMTPFWDLLCDPNHVTIAHAGREELRFCLHAVGRRPANLFDLQIAAGLVGLEYPAAYSTLLSKLLNTNLKKGETRTDWRRRPLTDKQIDYALQDVIYLEALKTNLEKRLRKLNRADWMQDEMTRWQDGIEESENREQWRRVSGLAGLSPRMLGIVREVWRWREAEAQSANRPAKRVLRDDLIVEMARRQTADEKRIKAVRGMERRGTQKHIGDLAKAIQRGLDLTDEECPQPAQRKNRQPLTLLGQFLATAVSAICRDQSVAPSLVGGAQDIRALVAHQLKLDKSSNGELPSLAKGWRAEVVGDVIDKMLRQELSISIQDPLSDQPLSIKSVTE